MLIRPLTALTEYFAGLKIAAEGSFTSSLHDSLNSSTMILIACIHLNLAVGCRHFLSLGNERGGSDVVCPDVMFLLLCQEKRTEVGLKHVG